MPDWKEIASTSHYRAAVAVKSRLAAGDVADAANGLEELIDALSRSERRALKSQLIRLMAHVIKWETQPDLRSRSWASTIKLARMEIRDIQDETPSLSDEVIRSLWSKAFEAAREQAEAEMGFDSKPTQLTWADVFEKSYRV